MNFASFSKSKFIWRNRDTNSENFSWKDVKWLCYSKKNFGKVKFKRSLNEEEIFKVLNVSKRGVNTAKLDEILKLPSDIKISSKKKKDLIDILPFIDPYFHAFYKNLLTEEISDIHPDLDEDDINEID